MDVIALVGPSGTGKSHRALIVAHEHQADAIIDDGLLIKDSKIVAGFSAKREPSKIKAVRRAIFMEAGHAECVRRAIGQVKPERILILATSENMAQKIAHVLELPRIREIIRIEDIATQTEMKKARDCRLKEGKHIIPVPTIELKPHFSGYLIDPMETFFKKPRMKRRKLGEKSIVRPTFSYYGKLLIADQAIAAIVNHTVLQQDGLVKAAQVKIKHTQVREGERSITVRLDVVSKYGTNLMQAVRSVQRQVKIAVEQMTGMLVAAVNVTVSGVIV